MKKIAPYILSILFCSCIHSEADDFESERSEIIISSVSIENSIITKSNPITGSETFGVTCLAKSNNEPASVYFQNEILVQSGDKWILRNGPFFFPKDYDLSMRAYGKSYDENKPNLIYISDTETSVFQWDNYSVANQDAASRQKYEDFLVSESIVSKVPHNNTNLALTFRRVLSKMYFAARIEQNRPIDAKITKITIHSCDQGTYGYHQEDSSEHWHTLGEPTLKEVELNDPNQLLTNQLQTVSKNSFYTIPNGEFSITVEAVLYNKGDQIPIANLTGTYVHKGLEANRNMKFNIIIDPNTSGLADIRFTEPTEEDWSQEDQI